MTLWLYKFRNIIRQNKYIEPISKIKFIFIFMSISLSTSIFSYAKPKLLCEDFIPNESANPKFIEEVKMLNNSILKIDKLLIVAAMDVEVKSILGQLNNIVEIPIHESLGIKLFKSKIGPREVYVAQSGIGLVSAALTAAYTIDSIKPSAILLLGVAGALDAKMDIGDIVVAEQVVQHDSVFSGENGNELMAPGELYLSVLPEERVHPAIKMNRELSKWLYLNLNSNKSQVHYGTLLSGSEFVGRASRKLEVSNLVEKALAVEMEAAGIAQVVKKYNIPFVVVKTIADRLNPDGSISSDYLKFSKSAADTAAEILNQIIYNWEK